MRSDRRAIAGAVFAILVAVCDAQPGSREAPALYAELCSGCHGEFLEGGKGPSLIKNKWLHGNKEEALFHSIRSGYPANGMPAFANAIDPAETRALVTYIREMGTRTLDPQPKEESPLPSQPVHSELHDFRIESVAEGLDVPWSIAFLPDRSMLVTERVGRLRVIRNGRLEPEPIRGVPRVIVRDEAGLMSVAADPDYASNGWIYLTFSDPGTTDESTMNKIIRARIRDGGLVDQQTIFSIPQEQYPRSFVLFGGRLAFQGPYLFFSIGERGMEEGTTGQAQDLAVPNGKIHRVFRDGTIPPDNPFLHLAGAWKSIWAYGVRNPQGLAFNPKGELWETEHGPRGGDELNHIERGKNYGWPIITYGMNYDGTPISSKTKAPGMEQPVIDWTPSIAVSELEFYTGDKFPKWKDQLFVGSLAQQKFLRIVLKGDKVVHREEVFKHLGRIRDIKTGPDGYLYLALELIGKPGRIVRLVPES